MGLNTPSKSSNGAVDDVWVEWMKEIGGTELVSVEDSFFFFSILA